MRPGLRLVCIVTFWRLGYTGEGARPCVESVTVKEIISKVDINKDGVLAAASAGQLNKGGYVLHEPGLQATLQWEFWMLNLPAGTSWFSKASLRVLF